VVVLRQVERCGGEQLLRADRQADFQPVVTLKKRAEALVLDDRVAGNRVDGHVPRRRHRQTAGRLALHHGIIRVVAAMSRSTLYTTGSMVSGGSTIRPEMALRMDSRFSGSKTCFFFGMSSSSAQQDDELVMYEEARTLDELSGHRAGLFDLAEIAGERLRHGLPPGAQALVLQLGGGDDLLRHNHQRDGLRQPADRGGPPEARGRLPADEDPAPRCVKESARSQEDELF